MEVLTKILQQGTEFDTLAETVLADRFEQLVQLATMISDKGELPIAVALANVVTTSQMVSACINRICFGYVTLHEM
jgi:neurofibromin 1